ncbi:hypothetical protein C0995_005611, partial [Termitomyces sp. Mi166
EDAQAYQLHVSPFLPKEHLWANTNVPTSETKSEEQILYTDMFFEGSAKELPPHHLYDHKINLEKGTLLLFEKIYNMLEVKL